MNVLFNYNQMPFKLAGNLNAALLDHGDDAIDEIVDKKFLFLDKLIFNQNMTRIRLHDLAVQTDDRLGRRLTQTYIAAKKKKKKLLQEMRKQFFLVMRLLIIMKL